jgi:acyl carrier protein
MTSVSETVIKAVAGITKRNPEELGPDTKLAEELMLKSINRIELAATLEEDLQVPISSFDILKPRTIGDIVAMIHSKKK